MSLRAGEADRREFAAFVERELPRLHRLALSLTGQPADADDLVQEALAKAWLHWSKVNASGSPGAYVRAILSNSFLSSRRRRSATELVSTDVVDNRSGTTDPVGDFVQRQDLLAEVLRLPPTQRVVIVLRYLEDLPVAEVAKILGKREGAVRGICHRGLESLRETAARPPVTTTDRTAHASA